MQQINKMKQLSLSGSPRENVGKKDAAELRKQGKVPVVLYGGSEQLHFCLEENDAKKLVFTPDVYKVEFDIAGKKVRAILQDVQIHPVTDRIQHMDFMEIQEGKTIKVQLPVILEGQARGVLNGGRLSQLYRKLTVVGMESDLPDAINIDISPLRIGHKKRVGDLSHPGVEFLDAASSVVVAVRAARGAMEDEEEDEEEGAEGAEGAEGEEKAAEAPAEGAEG